MLEQPTGFAMPGVCRWCSTPTSQTVHNGPCPKIRSIKYRPDGSVKSVEFNATTPVDNGSSAATEVNDHILRELEDAIKDYGEAGWRRQRARYLAARVRIENALTALSSSPRGDAAAPAESGEPRSEQPRYSVADLVIDHIKAATETLAIKAESMV